MTNYIDGFVLPIPKDRLDEYRRVVSAVANIWLEHGALAYREFIGDDLSLEGTRSFTDMVDAGETDAVIFGWIEFASREARELANAKVAADPRMPGLVGETDTGFDATTMAWGGFRPLLDPASA
ncbi:MAG: DUF1428 domain-containing protein [Pseudomonadota bacterium]